jgi:endonuclease YncB( thermonuclease family)
MRPNPAAARRVALAWLVLALALSCDRGAPAGSYPGARVISLARVSFDDGDTFYLDGKPVRILGIDTPETRSPGVGIMVDQPFGPAAAESTRALMTRAGRVEVVFDGRDAYGRRLAHVFVDGELLGVRLLRMGLAYENVTHFGDNGFPDLADRILEAAHAGPKPAFEPPYRWRQKHQVRK